MPEAIKTSFGTKIMINYYLSVLYLIPQVFPKWEKCTIWLILLSVLSFLHYFDSQNILLDSPFYFKTLPLIILSHLAYKKIKFQTLTKKKMQ